MSGIRRGGWVALLVLVVCSVAIVALPIFLIQPFSPQTRASLDLSFALHRWAPIGTLVALVAVVAWVRWLWSRQTGLLPRVGLVSAGLLAMASAWMARQNHFEWMFAPLHDARFVRATAADYVGSGDMVLAVTANGDAVAYPVNQLAYHHLVEDAIGGLPIVATY